MDIIIPASVTILGFLVNYFVTINNLKRELKKYKESRVYEIKLNAILDSMKFIDTYLSWHSMDNDILPIREDITEKELTVRARKCYNLLCSTCESSEIISCFIKIVFHENYNIFKLYNEFRCLARIELGLKNNIEFDNERVFLSVVATEDLKTLRTATTKK